MEAEISTTTQVINVWVQFLNLVIFYFIFKKLFGDQIIQWVEDRKIMINKIKNAEEQYRNMINTAKWEADSILQEALRHKQTIMDDAHILAKNQSDDFIKTTNRKADDIINTAQKTAEKLHTELKANFESGVKATAEIVVSKLIQNNPQLEQAYMEELIKETIKKS
jgi:F0F1-type ATP synthase membrane subunit b/b'